MLEVDRMRPALRAGLGLVSPEGTGTYFVYDKESGDRFELNEVAFELMSRMDGTRTISELAVEIREVFEGAAEAADDLQDLLAFLQEEKLVVLNTMR